MSRNYWDIEGGERSESLTFEEFSKTNMQRHVEWPRQNGKMADGEWDLTKWAVALAEETGEVCGAIKRLNRLEAGHIIKRGESQVLTEDEAYTNLRREIGGVLTYLDLLAQALGVTLEDCIREEFNAVSEREGLPHRI